jgi:hypothetical protein
MLPPSVVPRSSPNIMTYGEVPVLMATICATGNIAMVYGMLSTNADRRTDTQTMML